VDDDLSDDEDVAYEMSGGVKPDAIEPPLPVGLGSLTAAQKALVEFLDLNPDLVTAAATASADATPARDTSEEMAEWVAQVAADDARKYLLLILQGQVRQVEQQLRYAYAETQRASSSLGKAADNRRSVAEIRQLVGKARVERRAREAKQKQKELEKKRQERERYLTTLAQDVEKHWKQVGKLAEQQIASAYDRARDLLVDLSDAATLTNTRDDFARRFRQFQTVHGRRSALRQRLEKAKLLG
jgi:hypothetical protein